MYNMHVELVGVPLKRYAYVCHVAQVETTLQHCLADVCGVESEWVCRGGGGGANGAEGSVVSALVGSLHNLMHTILKMPSAVIARAMGWNCSTVSVSHLSQSQLVGHTNTSPPELGGGGGGGVEMGEGRSVGGWGDCLGWGWEECWGGGGGPAEVGRVGVLGGGGGRWRLVATFSYPLRTDIPD